MGVPRSLAVVIGVALGVVLGVALTALGLGAPALATPAPERETVRVMFVGDSLTGSPGCWRAPVWVSLTDAGYDLEMVGINTVNECGDVTNTIGSAWDPDNTGIGGATSTRAWVKLARDKVLEQYQPQVIVQLLGTNDLLGGSSADAVLEQYDKLLELYRDYNPSVTVVVGTPPPIDSGVCGCDAAQSALAATLPGWAQGVSTAESPVFDADLSSGFDPAVDTDDGIHPNDSGNAVLAAAWTPVIEDALDAALEAVPASPSATPDEPIPTDAYPPATPSAVWVLVGLLLVALGVGAAVARSRNR
ncbi:GDSL-type esterase/lipase family protein [Demequina sp.]|uniref:GDSL-type esterase/lipase family protein n=1 Tax=Demequina sp. TaxID=2050685 RepID=UPI003D0E01A4